MTNPFDLEDGGGSLGFESISDKDDELDSSTIG